MAKHKHDLFLGLAATLALGAFAEATQIAWGSGFFVGRLSAKWLITLLLFAAGLAALLWIVRRSLYTPEWSVAQRNRIAAWLPPFVRFTLALLFVLLPWVFIYYSPWGGLFTGLFTRSLLYSVAVFGAALCLSPTGKTLLSWRSSLLALLLVGCGLVLGDAFVRVTDYPLALHWSEGNRLWDYSILFGRARYAYPVDQPIFVWIDPGRQTLWGLPFLSADLTIAAARAWSALMTTLPYALLGWFAFRPLPGARRQWFLAGLWALLFLNQGPIYAPLILSAILVAFARRKPLWLSIPLVALAGVYAGTSRFTWSFAPAIWAVMLALSDAALQHPRLRVQDVARAAILGLSGLWSKGLPILTGIVNSLLAPAVSSPMVDGTPGAQGVTSVQGLQAVVTSQPYAWQRMLPNDVFPPGILLGLLAAVGPLAWLCIYLARKGYWKTTQLQHFAVVGGLLAFLGVGLIASAKVGGGADLHNLDMLLVSCVLLAGVAWEAGLHQRLGEWLATTRTVQACLLAMLVVPALFPLYSGAPLSLPDDERMAYIMQRLDSNILCAAHYGPVLFLDQRQLLTFRYQQTIALNPEYEKKYVMDQALAGNRAYFEAFVDDLAAHKYSLIVGELEDTLFRGRNPQYGDSLAEENNAWKRWVSLPLLRYYQSIHDFRDAGVEIFMPIGRSFSCP